MAFDAGMAKAVCAELRERFLGAKVEKVYQPSGEEVLLFCRRRGEGRRLLISASPSGARICETSLTRENPKTPPMFCMQLRKHLAGAVIAGFEMPGFERVVEVAFDGFDEMGFACRKYLEAEIMGKCSNLILLTEENGRRKVTGALKSVDFTTSSKRQVLPGMTYELPPAQGKADPMTETAQGFEAALSLYPAERPAEKFILDTYQGLSPLAAREIAYRAGCLGIPAGELSGAASLWRSFAGFRDRILAGEFRPIMLSRSGTAALEPFEYSFFETEQYGAAAVQTAYPDFAALLDAFYGTKEAIAAMKSKSRDIESVIGTARHKLLKKLPQLEAELAECAQMERYKLWGDLITASIYMLKQKAPFCDVTNYYSEKLETVRIPLDGKLTPSQNAAKYYKKYAKLKTAKDILTKQIEKAREELFYLASVEDAAGRAESEEDLSGIRAELAAAGYGAAGHKAAKTPAAGPAMKVSRFHTSGGRELYVGRNNLQNDYLTTRLAKKSDFWFHVKGGHGSHVVMACGPDEEPSAEDFTEAAETAAYYSEMRNGQKVPVDYTRIKNVKKPSGAVPGKVIYTTNYTAYVEPKKPAEAT